jgi:polyisoprenyl-teichoic acid--peptidoglycan teichoic acid transferase
MRRRLLAVTLALTAWVGGTVVGSLGGTVAGATPLLMVGRAHAEHTPALTGEDPIFVLIMGSDSRPGTPVDRGLCDSIHILGINPADGRATLFGFPRDSYVPLASGGTGKINSAMPAGGPQAQIATVENLTGITFDYYALTGFRGLRMAVDEIGGLTIDSPDAFSGYFQVYPEGTQTLDGAKALDYARTRKSLSRGDFSRSYHQSVLMRGALAQFRGEFGKDGDALFTWLGAGLRHVDTSLGIDELTSLAFLATQIKPANVTSLVATGSIGTAGGASVVNLSSTNAALYQDLAADGYILAKDIPADAVPIG